MGPDEENARLYLEDGTPVAVPEECPSLEPTEEGRRQPPVGWTTTVSAVMDGQMFDETIYLIALRCHVSRRRARRALAELVRRIRRRAGGRRESRWTEKLRRIMRRVRKKKGDK